MIDWSTTQLPAQDGGGGDKGEVIQGDCRGIIVFKQEIGEEMAQDYREEGYGDHDTAAGAHAEQDSGDSDVDHGSHVVDAVEETEPADEDEVNQLTSMRWKDEFITTYSML